MVIFLFVRVVLTVREEFMEREAGSRLEDDFAHLETRLLRLEKGWEEERSS